MLRALGNDRGLAMPDAPRDPPRSSPACAGGSPIGAATGPGVIITVKLKLDWQDRMAFDRAVGHLAFRVGFAIGSHLNRHTGEAFVGRSTLAEKLGVSVRAIDKAITLLERLGHLAVQRGGGRRCANTYKPNFSAPRADTAQSAETANEASPFGHPAPSETANEASPFGHPAPSETANEASPFSLPETANKMTRNGERNDAKRRTPVRPNPYITQLITLGGEAPHAEAQAPPLQTSHDPRSELEARWLAIRRQLETRLGRDRVRAWLDVLTVEKTDNGDVVLSAASRFVARYNSTHHVELLLEAWQASLPGVRRVTIKLRGQPAPGAAGVGPDGGGRRR